MQQISVSPALFLLLFLLVSLCFACSLILGMNPFSFPLSPPLPCCFLLHCTSGDELGGCKYQAERDGPMTCSYRCDECKWDVCVACKNEYAEKTGSNTSLLLQVTTMMMMMMMMMIMSMIMMIWVAFITIRFTHFVVV
jgi:hypothetical protein